MHQIGDRRSARRVEPRLRQHRIGAARRRDSLVGRPAVARAHQAQIVEPAIHHRPRRGPDVLAELRLDQDDRGTRRHRLPAMIGAGHPQSFRHQVVVPSGLSSRGCPRRRARRGCGRLRRSGAGVAPRPARRCALRSARHRLSRCRAANRAAAGRAAPSAGRRLRAPAASAERSAPNSSG